jgi:hypothetical protein
MTTSIRRFDLYDFFSVLLPGSALLLGLVPFLPNKTDFGSLGVLLPFLVAGFVIGRAIHSVAVGVEKRHQKSDSDVGWIESHIIYPLAVLFFAYDWTEDVTHRRYFIIEIKNKGDIDEKVVKLYLRLCRDAFNELDIPKDPENITDNLGNSIYNLTRSHIHIDARGRSRTFQAVYAFYRSMWIVSLFLSIVYILYGVIVALRLNRGIVDYTSIIGSFGVQGSLISLLSFVLAVGTYYAFSSAKWDYQKYYIEYLLADFIVIQNDVWDTLESVETLLGR